MKLHLSILTGVASVAAIMSNVFADTAVTDPVGYVTVSIAGSASGSTVSVVSPTLTKPVYFAGKATGATAAPNTITFAANSFSPAQVAELATGNYWVETTYEDASEGAWTNITGATSDSITTADDMTAFVIANTTTVKIRSHTTVGDFFGLTNAAGLGEGPDAGIADEVVFLDSTVDPPTPTTVFYDGTGWFDGEFNDANPKHIEPGQGLLIVRKLVPDISFVYVGHVKTGVSQVAVYPGVNVIPVPQATGITLADSTLYTGNPTTGLTDGPDAGIADEIVGFDNEGVGTSYFNDGTGWFDGEFNDASTKLLKEGDGAYIIRKAPGVAFNWKAPKVIIAP